MTAVTIELSAHWQAFIDDRIAQGRLQSIQDAVEVGLDFLKADEAKYDALVLALKEGDESGPATPWDMATFLAEERLNDEQRKAA
jgi:antitoxin ParD1/3/4